MSWTRGRLLSSYYVPGDGDYFNMSYSADGKRVQKTQSYDDETSDWVTTYSYNGNNLVCQKEEDGSSTYYKYFLYNSQGLVGFVYAGTVYTYRKNLFGDITAIYNGSTKVAEYAYDAWGNCTVTNLTISNIGSINPFRYRGYYWDEDLQLYYLMSRYYDPQTGRFINADSVEQLNSKVIGGLNLYNYNRTSSLNGGAIRVKDFLTNFAIKAGNIKNTLPAYVSNLKGFINNSVLTQSNTVYNHVLITSETIMELISNKNAAFWFGNISITQSHNWNNADGFYSFSIIGDDNIKKGFGFSHENMIGCSAYISDDWRVGFTTQAGPFTFGSEISVSEGIGISVGATDGTEATDITLNISWAELALCFALASVPAPGARIASGILAVIFSIF